MKKYFEIKELINPLELIKKINTDCFSLIDNGQNNFILGWNYKKSNVLHSEHLNKNVFNFLKNENNDYLFGYLGYDLKNDILSKTESSNSDFHKFPNLGFFRSEFTIIKKDKFTIFYGELKDFKKLTNILSIKDDFENKLETKINLKPQLSKKEYLKKIIQIKSEIQNGQIYEMNFCTQFITENVNINIRDIYYELNKSNQAPFSSLFKLNEINILSASPERFFKKYKSKIVSQPIKGTSARSTNKKQDDLNKENLVNNQKEISENIMIVDLVRNDLSKIAVKNSVNTEELCRLYKFKNVFQLISKISAELEVESSIQHLINALFPMGSMTGAPKQRSVELIEKYENFKRGAYSGALGFITPNNNIDFNVIIRSIIYNSKLNNLSCSVGGAITINSTPEGEYSECLLKLRSIEGVLSSK